MSSLNLYLCTDPRGRLDTRLIVARDLEQATAMTKVGTMVTKCNVFQAYRLGKLGVELEYARPTYQKESA